MDPTVVLLFAMVFVSLMLTVVLVTAWNSFGRPAHALSWSSAFAIAAVGWTLQIMMIGPHSLALDFAVGILSMGTWGALLVGFRQRAGQRISWPRAGAILAVALIGLVAAMHRRDPELAAAVPLMFAAAMLALSAGTMMFGTRSPAERAVITMLLAFAILDTIATAGALTPQAVGGEGEIGWFRALILLTLPSAFTGTGLFAVFLLAADLAERMSKLASSDPLTGALNRRGFEAAAARVIANARRQGQPLTVVAADLDRFKSINDRFGHACGDKVLCRFVEHVSGSIRAGDLLGRLGGEEFAMILVDASPSAAMDAVDRIRASLGRIDIQVGRDTLRITASFGVTGPGSQDDDLAAMLARADSALYQAKIAGRDRVVLAPLPPTISPELRKLAAAADAALELSK